MRVLPLTDADRSRWDRYVQCHPDGLPQHLSGWRDVLTDTYGYETHYLLAEAAGGIVGVMPLYAVHSLFLGSKVTTMPGGLCADSSEVASALIERGKETARAAGADRLVLHDTRRQWPGNLQTSTEHVYWLMDLRMSVDELWDWLDGNIRRQVRIARRNDLHVEIDRTGALLDTFYDLLSHFTHAIGTPTFGRDFVEHVVATFPNGFDIAIVYAGDTPIGSYFQLEMADTVYGLWGATLPDYLDLRPVYLAYWEILRDAIEHGFLYLDMGRSRAGSGVSKHKGQWGGVSHPIHQQVAPVGANGSVDSVATKIESDATFQWIRELWPKLPYPVAQFLGPKLRRHVPFG